MIVPIPARYKDKLVKYLAHRQPDGMVVEPLPMEGEFSVDDILVSLSTKIDACLGT